MMQKLSFLALFFLLASCGSLKTVTSSNEEIAFDLYKNKTLCESSTRVYSGVSYDLCRFHAEPTGSYDNAIGAVFYLFDIVLFSPAADTIMLPVTVYQQAKYGNPKVYKPKN